MIEIAFYLEQPKTSWNATIHQLNSDILRRHILPKLQSTNLFIDFQYCEQACEGTILSESGSKLGRFFVK